MKRSYNSVGAGEKPNLGASTSKINSPGGNQKAAVAKGSQSSAVNRPGAQTEVRTRTSGSKYEINRPGGGEQCGRKFGPVDTSID